MPATVETTPCLPGLSPVAGKPVLAHFDGESLSSGGLLTLCEVEKRLGIAAQLAACIDDPRAPECVRHGLNGDTNPTSLQPWFPYRFAHGRLGSLMNA